MKSHRFDPLSFVFGAAFIALSLVLTSGAIGVITVVRLRWLGAAFLLALGIAMVVTSSTRGRRPE
jgi:hypothetical protein